MIVRISIIIVMLFGLSGQGKAQSPFLLQNVPLDLQKLYKNGSLDSLVNTCRTNFLAVKNDPHHAQYWQSYQYLLFAYFTTEKWDLTYLLSDDLTKKFQFIDNKSESYALFSLIKGVALNEIGRAKEADAWFKTALKITDQDISQDAHLFIMIHYANYLRQLGEYSAAGKILDQLEYSHKRGKDYFKHWQLDLLFTKISLEMEMGLISNAQKSLNQIHSLYETKDLNGERMVKVHLLSAAFHLSQGNLEKANFALENASLALNTLPTLSNQRLVLQLLTMRRDNYLNKPVSMDIGQLKQVNPSIFVRLLIEKGKSHHLQKEYELAIKVYNNALDFIKKNYSPEHPIYEQLIEKKGISAWANGDISKATNYFNLAARLKLIQFIKNFAFLSDAEKKSFYENNNSFENIYGSFVREQSKYKPVLLEQLANHQMVFKGLLFNQSLTLRKMAYANNSLRATFDQYLNVRSRIQLIRQVSKYTYWLKSSTYDSLQATSQKLERELSIRTFLLNQENITNTLASSWSELRNKLSPSQAMLEVIRIQSFDPVSMQTQKDNFFYLYLFFNRYSKKPQLLSANGLEIEKQLAYYRNAIKYKIKDVKSYSILWEPVEKAFKLRRYKDIFFVPDGIYNLMNISSLFSSKDDDFMLSKYAINILGNSQDFFQNKIAASQVMEALLIGNPSFDSLDMGIPRKIRKQIIEKNQNSNTIQMLPGTEQEVQIIANLMDNASVPYTMWTEEEASESNLKGRTQSWNSPQLIHLATHGFFENNTQTSSEDPLENAGLLMAGARFANDTTLLREMINSLENENIVNNGVLFAREAMDMHLMTTDLVVLSACESGVGEVTPGEGVYGLHRGFQTAGAKSVLMTLWKVDDQATKEFMIYFYVDWVETKDAKHAYQYAQKVIKEKYEQPYYWASFILVGG